MTKYDDLGHGPEEVHGRKFAPADKRSDGRGHNTHPDSLPADESGVREWEEKDATWKDPG